MSDIVREMKKKAGFDVDEPTQTTTRQTQTTASKKKKAKKEQEAQDAGGLGSIFGKLGIDMGNLGGLAESVLKTIGLAGKAI